MKSSWSILLLYCLLSPSASAVDYLLEEQLHTRLRLAEQGNVDSQYLTGDMYLKGRGTLVDLAQARYWFGRAAGEGHRKAQFKLGYMHLKGIGVQQDSRRALQLFQASADNGYAPAQFYLGQMYALGIGVNKSRNLALKWLRASLEEGYRPPKAEVAKIREDLDRAMKGAELSAGAGR